MRSLPFVITAILWCSMTAAGAQTADRLPRAGNVIAEAETDSDAAESAGRPLATAPILSEPLPAFATGAPLRLEPPKPGHRPRQPSRPLPSSQPRPY